MGLEAWHPEGCIRNWSNMCKDPLVLLVIVSVILDNPTKI